MFQGAEVSAQEAFECVGESANYLTVLFMKRNQNTEIKLAASFCFYLFGGAEPTPKPHTGAVRRMVTL